MYKDKVYKQEFFNLLDKMIPRGYKIIAPSDYKEIYDLDEEEDLAGILEPGEYYAIKITITPTVYFLDKNIPKHGTFVSNRARISNYNYTDIHLKNKTLSKKDFILMKGLYDILDETFSINLIIAVNSVDDVNPDYSDYFGYRKFYVEEIYKDHVPAHITGAFDDLVKNL